MHSSVMFEVALANWLITQRCAIWSYSTTGSPWPLFSQTPPKPLQNDAVLTGPSTEAPVVLLKTCTPPLVICTYCVAPTSPSVSGGAQPQPFGWPSKLRIGNGIIDTGDVRFCTTGSTLSTWCTGRSEERRV